VSWSIDGKFHADLAVDISDEDGFVICEISPLDEDWTPAEIKRVHLIAAAPELLDALKRAAQGLRNLIEFGVLPPNYRADAEKYAAEYESVIAKAETL